jgi:hypothetical protein
MPRWGTYLSIFVILVLGGIIAAQYRTRPCEVQANAEAGQPTILGPFRPRPKPEPPVPHPDLADLDLRERRLFERFSKLLDAREERLEARAYNRMAEALNGLTDDLEAYDPDNPKIQGPFSGAIITALWNFAVKAAKFVLNTLIIGVLVGLLYLYWPWIAGAVVFLIGALRLWIGSIVNRAVKP